VGAALLAPTAAAQEKVEFFDVPAGAHPHDVSPAPDGKVWYTAQAQGALGILDPTTGAVEQVPLGEGSAPHGVITGPDGKAWITDSGQNAIVSVDPGTREVAVYPLPEATGYSNLNTAAFAPDGTLWFTGQNGIYGRLDPDSGDMRVFDAPKGRGPYGITSTPDGDVYYASLAGSYVGRIDTATGEATVIEPPTTDQGARRVWSDSQGNIWVSEWNSGQVSRYTPASDTWQTWQLPGDDPKAYAVYVDEEDIVWLSDFGANAVVRFDPSTEAFTRFEGSAPGANVRQILGRAGEVWAPESGTDRLMVIRTAAD
jgi:virginiamycin B lyase